LRLSVFLYALAVAPQPLPAEARQHADASKAGARDAGAERDGQRDFDFEIGTWKTRLKRLQRPLTGSTTWVEYEGTSVVRRVWNGRANLGELDVAGSAGQIRGLSLRLYNPESGQWNISWASSSNGTMGPPMVGEFKNGRGEFFNQEMLNGRAIYVRFVFSDITPKSFRFEQSFSDDGGRTWEVNWKATFTKVSDKGQENRDDAPR
jgi:hypothetical protein